MKHASRRQKGHNWERKIANDLKMIDPTARRALEYQEGLGYDISTKLPLAIQCKSQKKPNFLKALQEAEGSLNPKQKVADWKMPVAAIKVTNKGEYAFLNWSDFLLLLKRAFISL